MNYNSLHAAGQVWGAILLFAALAGLVAIEAWGPLAFIVGGACLLYAVQQRLARWK